MGCMAVCVVSSSVLTPRVRYLPYASSMSTEVLMTESQFYNYYVNLRVL